MTLPTPKATTTDRAIKTNDPTEIAKWLRIQKQASVVPVKNPLVNDPDPVDNIRYQIFQELLALMEAGAFATPE